MQNDDIYLTPLLDAEFAAFRDRVVCEFAEQSAAAGRVTDEHALPWAQEQIDRLLPDGSKTKDTYLFKVMSHHQQQEVLGYLWSGRDSSNANCAYLFDMYIVPESRRKGIGKASLQQLHEILKRLEYKAINLHVYASNKAAISLYDTCGYVPVSHVLRKPL
jgi:ribosomal protein S18 acetylase RimI-like enzyme